MPSRMRIAQVGRAGYFSRWPKEKSIAAHEQGVNPFSRDDYKGCVDLVDGAGVESKNLHPKGRGDFTCFF